MARQTFFSFKYEDVTRAMVVRNSWVTQDARGFVDKADFEKIKQRGDAAIRSWIDAQLVGTSVTVVLVGAHTNQSRWVKYEIDQSIARGNGLLGIDVSKIRGFDDKTTERCAHMPLGYPFYLWYKDAGYKNLGSWIEAAARKAGRT